MTLPFDPTTARTVARDRAAALRRDWVAPHTSSWWRTGTPTESGPADGTPTEKRASRTTRTPASAS
jgi:hypothetical protein